MWTSEHKSSRFQCRFQSRKHMTVFISFIKPLVIYCYSISTNLVKEVLFRMDIHFILTNEIKKASLIIGLKKYLKKNNNLIQIASTYNIPIYTFNFISYYQLIRLFSSMAHCESQRKI